MNSLNKNVITRIAPAPTGQAHLGTAYVLAVCWYYTKENGIFHLRIDDTDEVNTEIRYIHSILKLIYYFNMDYSGIYRQSSRKALYKKYQERIPCVCIDDKTGAHQLQIETSNSKIGFYDENYGYLSRQIKDIHFPICYNHKQFFYSYCSVIDDFDLKVNLIVRGNDLIDSTFSQSIMFKYLNHEVSFMHLPMMLTKEKRKISKSDEDSKHYTVEFLFGKYLPICVKIYLLYPDISIKIISYDFNFPTIRHTKNNWCYDVDKLYKIQKKYIESMPASIIFNELCMHYNISYTFYTDRVIDVWKTRSVTLDEIAKRLKYYQEHYIQLNELYQNKKDTISILIQQYNDKILGNKYNIYTVYRKIFAGTPNSPSLEDLITIFKI